MSMCYCDIINDLALQPREREKLSLSFRMTICVLYRAVGRATEVPRALQAPSFSTGLNPSHVIIIILLLPEDMCYRGTSLRCYVLLQLTFGDVRVWVKVCIGSRYKM
jgi:hypothetical protein